MTVVINSSTSRQDFLKILEQMRKPRRKFNAQAFCGKVKFVKNPVSLQKMWRDEW